MPDFSALVFCHSKQHDAKNVDFKINALSDTAQHTMGVLVFSPRKKISVYVLINLTAERTWTVAIYTTVTGLRSIGIV